MKEQYSDVFWGVVAALISLQTWYLLSFAIDKEIAPGATVFYSKFFIQVVILLGGLIGTFFLNRYFENRKWEKQAALELEKNRKEKVDTINAAIISLTGQYNALGNIGKFIKEVDLDPNKLVLSEPRKGFRDPSYVNVAGLYMSIGEDPNLILELQHKQDCMFQLIQVVDKCIEHHIEHWCPHVRSLPSYNLGEFDVMEMDVDIHNDGFELAKNQIEQYVKLDSEFLKTINKLSLKAKKIYPEYEILFLSPLDDGDS